jgi:hypothetical protein
VPPTAHKSFLQKDEYLTLKCPSAGRRYYIYHMSPSIRPSPIFPMRKKSVIKNGIHNLVLRVVNKIEVEVTQSSAVGLTW